MRTHLPTQCQSGWAAKGEICWKQLWSNNQNPCSEKDKTQRCTNQDETVGIQARLQQKHKGSTDVNTQGIINKCDIGVHRNERGTKTNTWGWILLDKTGDVTKQTIRWSVDDHINVFICRYQRHEEDIQQVKAVFLQVCFHNHLY